MSDKRDPNPVLIHKYPNRRFYDTQNSRHVTLQEIHDLIMSGRDVSVTDTATGEDLTNVVLLQILLEQDHPKFNLFPSSVIHMMLRSSRNNLRSTVDRFFGPLMGMMAAGQKQFDSYIRESMKGQLMSPLEWTKGMFQAFGGDGAGRERASVRNSSSKSGTKKSPQTRKKRPARKGKSPK